MKLISIRNGVVALVVVGDVWEGTVHAFAYLRRIVPMPIILMVAGNQEFYHSFIPSELTLARAQAPNFNMHCRRPIPWCRAACAPPVQGSCASDVTAAIERHRPM
jgi:hypothetical protein